ncbi:mitochondrial pyruvate dehydrogenase E1 component beta subunit [Hyaloraphidium curvatum]|nr:mitochondrial pyruvate dehydrogenase E1 component beta subunit [Hyaloraphidium curvatum]
MLPRTAPVARALCAAVPRALRAPPALRRAYASVAPDAEKVFEIEMPEGTFASHLDCPMPSLTTRTTKSECLDIYATMVAIRRIETASDALYKSRLIRGFCHLSTGQEAIAAGMERAITRKDAIITAYRCHGFMYTRGASPKEILAELMGRKDGCSKGKGGTLRRPVLASLTNSRQLQGGSMHMYVIPNNFYGGNGIVGAQIPLGAGIAFAQKYRGEKTMTFSLYGDGAANQGQAFEAYNMAKLWKLPIAFVCENNMYGMGTRQDRAAANTKFYTRCEYIPGIRVNGMDVFAVRDACAMAKEWTAAGNGPLLMEFVTYRYGGHSMSDPGTTYRSREEIQYMRSTNDPIRGLQKRLLEGNIASEEEMKAIEARVRKEVDQQLEEAKQSPEPPMSELFADVYTKGKEIPVMRGCDPEDLHYFGAQK